MLYSFLLIPQDSDLVYIITDLGNCLNCLVVVNVVNFVSFVNFVNGNRKRKEKETVIRPFSALYPPCFCIISHISSLFPVSPALIQRYIVPYNEIFRTWFAITYCIFPYM